LGLLLLGPPVDHFEALAPPLVKVAEVYAELLVLAFDLDNWRVVLGAAADIGGTLFGSALVD